MAITLHTTGAVDYPLSVYNSNSLRFTSNNASIANIIYRVYDVTNAEYITPELRQPPINTGSANFDIDISELVQGAFRGYPTDHFYFYQGNSLTAGTDSNQLVDSSWGMKQFRIDYKEEEEGADGLLTSPATLTTGETFFFIQSARQHNDYYNASQLNFYNYIITATQTQNKFFLTNMPHRVKIPVCDKNYDLHFSLFSITKDSGAPNLQPKFSMSTGSFVGMSTTSGLQQKIVGHKYSPAAINDISGFSGIDFDYRYKLTDGTNDLTEIYNFSMKRCNCKDVLSLMWINPYGVPDFFTFTGSTEKRAVASSKMFRKYRGFRRSSNQGLLAGTNANTFNQPFGVNGKIDITGNKRISVISQIMQVEIAEWLTEILTSPRVSIISPDEPHVEPVIVTSNEMEYKQENSGLVRISFEMEFANPRITQRG